LEQLLGKHLLLLVRGFALLASRKLIMLLLVVEVEAEAKLVAGAVRADFLQARVLQ
jgi:hypothetical protein